MEHLQITEAHIHNIGWALGAVLFIVVSSVALGLLAQLVARLFRQSPSEQKKVFWGFTFAAPWIVGFIIFVIGPALVSLLLSFSSYRLGDNLVFIQSDLSMGNYEDFWIELDHYRTLLVNTDTGRGQDFKQALFNSLYYTVIGVPLQIIAALAMAVLLNRDWRGISVFRTIYYLPVILAASPAALLTWRYMFTANGGFINNALQNFAEAFFAFDWLYRGFIYVAEGFNGFYAGIAAGQPVGAFKFTLPAALGVLALLTLLGEWTPHKRQRAYQMAEILGLIVLGVMLPGILKTPVNSSWTLAAGILVAGMALVNFYRDKRGLARIWLVTGLGLFVISLFLTLRSGQADFGNPDMTRYVLVLVAGGLPVVATLVIPYWRLKVRVTGLMLVVLGLLIVGRAAPSHFDNGAWQQPIQYLALRNTTSDQLESDLATVQTVVARVQADDELSNRQKRGEISDTVNEIYDDWKGPFNDRLFSAYWLYGLLIVILGGLYVLDEKHPRTRRYLLGGGLAFFILMGLGTWRNGRAYFDAFAQIEQASSVEGLTTYRDVSHYHFVSFRARTDSWPTQERVPQWLSNELWTKPSLVMITMWSSGASMLIFLAALKGVPPVLYEAAKVDGANAMQRFFKITLPMISPAMFYNIVIGVIAALQTFEAIYIIRDPSGSNDASLRSVAYFLYTRTFNDLAIGQGAAASWILAAIIMTLTVLQFRYSKWVNYEV